ncbi:hypothetical protein NM688_g3446 [Phlebia brevispora]|uniref:Uncharacterized protein n=1 Tax=Phlebia brevispora TaxID=194682 RepID=A0ACC1T5N6_9APHY|nr:hypothetical protein NM688_g3446 [Phlebia brevispora]
MTADRWTACARSMKQHDESMVHGWKEEIDTLLVFAGLFSAVLTAFTVESYQNLQADPQAQMIGLLQTISLQLQSQLNASILNDVGSSRSFSPGGSFQPTGSARRVNTLWFSALVCSLVVALVGILAKQWLREYISEVPSSPRESVRLRQYRYNGLLRWRVGEIMAVLPIILETSLVLFLIGLVDFLWSYDGFVAFVVTLLVAVSLVSYCLTTLLPAFSADSPFKSPQSWAFLKIMHYIRPRRFFRPLSTFQQLMRRRSIITSLLHQVDGDAPNKLPENWRDREIHFVKRDGNVLDHHALAWTYKTSFDDDLLDYLVPCLSDVSPEATASFAFEVIARKGECTVPVLLESIRSNRPELGLEKFISRAGSRGKERLMVILLDLLPRMVYDTQHNRVSVMDVMHTLRKLVVESELAFCELPLHRRTLDTLASLLDEKLWPQRVQLAALDLLSAMTDMRCNMLYCPEGVSFTNCAKAKAHGPNLSGIHNVALCARNSIHKREFNTFRRASSILLTRLSSLHGFIQDPEWCGRSWLQGFLQDIEKYFRIQNRTHSRYSVTVRIPWCSGLLYLAEQDRSLLSHALITTLEDGICLGLLTCVAEEKDAMSRLKEMYLMDVWTTSVDSSEII